MDYLEQSFSVPFQYRVFFTSDLFSADNNLLSDFLNSRAVAGTNQKILFVIDKGVADSNPGLEEQISNYFSKISGIYLVPVFLVIPGGEAAKNTEEYFDAIVKAVNDHAIDRHSYLAAIGGGSILDLAGYAAAVSHRGIKHIRIPTTVLSQNDSGVGVKNGINYKGKKNFLGTFAPPVAVFNDDQFLKTLGVRDWRSGIAEAIKVALIKDLPFFEWIESHAVQLASRDQGAMNRLIRWCAQLHLEHIAGGDPFESGSSRPLDFGHWSAHKLEQLTNFEVLHGEAVAMGIALDTVYSVITGRLSSANGQRVTDLLITLGFPVSHTLMAPERTDSPILLGLQEFREHLGGRLTIMLLRDIGKGEEVHEIDTELMIQAGIYLQELQKEKL